MVLFFPVKRKRRETMWQLFERLSMNGQPLQLVRACSSMMVKKFDPPENPNYFPGLLRLMR